MDGRTLLKRYEEVLQEAQFLRGRNRQLEQDLRVSGPALYRADQRIDQLEQRVEKLAAENRLLEQRIADLTLKLKQTPKPKPSLPAFVKANVAAKVGRKKPGRRAGHAAALRPMPAVIDVHQEVPVPIDSAGKPSCPHCRTQLADVARDTSASSRTSCPRRSSPPAITRPADTAPDAAGSSSRARPSSRRRRTCPTRSWA